MPDQNGLIFIREHYPWRLTPTYRRPDGTLEYHWTLTGEIAIGWQELKPLVLRDWRPVAQEDVRTYLAIVDGKWD